MGLQLEVQTKKTRVVANYHKVRPSSIQPIGMVGGKLKVGLVMLTYVNQQASDEGFQAIEENQETILMDDYRGDISNFKGIYSILKTYSDTTTKEKPETTTYDYAKASDA